MNDKAVRYLVFDVESVADGELVRKVIYNNADITPEQAVSEYRAQLMAETGSDFIQYTFQIPVSVVVAKVAADLSLIDVVALDEPQFRPHMITDRFWRGWSMYQHPTFVTFNGRSFDVPLMELAAFRYGISLPAWFNMNDPSFKQHRNRYNSHSHLDLHDVLTNFGATRFKGGLNLVANILGKPGKMELQGHKVQDYFNDGKVDQINDYCRCDVLDTYFAFLRTQVLLGEIDLDEEQGLVEAAKTWVESQAGQREAYRVYLNNWGSWWNPWKQKDA